MDLSEHCWDFAKDQYSIRKKNILPGDILKIAQNWIKENENITLALIKDNLLPDASVVECLELMSESLTLCWSKVRHFHALFNHDSWKEPYENALILLEKAHTIQKQNHDLYLKIRNLQIPESHPHHDLYLRRIKKWCRDFERGGITLNTTQKKEFQLLSEKLVGLENQYEENITASQDSWSFTLDDPSKLIGIPFHLLEQAQKNAQHQGQSGYCFTLSQPTYQTIMRNAQSSDLRETFYHAYQTIASPEFPGNVKKDNAPIGYQILNCKHQISKLLGFESIPDFILEKRMLKKTEEVLDFLQNLKQKVLSNAKKELAQVQDFFEKEYKSPLRIWDLAFAQQKMQQKVAGFDSEMLRDYFPLQKVKAGLFDTLSDLFEIQCIPSQTVPFELWNPHVTAYDLIARQDGKFIGTVIMDLFARPGKRQGAWMDECQNHLKIKAHTQNPIAFLTCNFSPPGENDSAYLTHEDVITLFHECGHCIHHLLTQVPIPSLSGINGVEWDAVELPSQFLECFAWEGPRLQNMSAHRETQEPLPQSLIDSMITHRNFQNAIYLLRQIEMSLFDILLHLKFDPEQDVEQIRQILLKLRKETSLLTIPEYARVENQFSHIFSGGYSAGYYSYLWAEIMAIDAYQAFVENPADFSKTGHAFKHEILQQGASHDAHVLFQNFRGRMPQLDAFLKYYELT